MSEKNRDDKNRWRNVTIVPYVAGGKRGAE